MPFLLLNLFPQHLSLDQNLQLSKDLLPEDKNPDLFLQLHCFFIFDLEEQIKSLVKSIINFFVQINSLVPHEIFLLFRLNFMKDC